MIIAWTNDAGELESLTFDATLREVLNRTATATKQPLDTGALTSDHVIVQNRRASFEVFVSDSPSSEPATQMFGVRGRVQSLDVDGGKLRKLKRGASGLGRVAAEYVEEGVKATANVLQFDGPFARRERVWGKLDTLCDGKVPVIAICELAELDDCVIVSVGAPLDDKTGDGISFALELEQIRFATTATAEVPEPEEPRGVPPQDGGAVTPEEQEETSLLYQGARATIGGVF